VLSAIKEHDINCKVYFAGSSEMFGNAPESPQHEDTPLRPRSAYGISKVAGHHLTVNYREAYGLHASSGIMFNHESPRRGIEFVTRKITDGVAKFAGDYVEAMWLMLQQDEPGEYVVATGETWSIRQLLEMAFGHVNLNWQDYVAVDEKFFRPSDIHQLVGDASKVRRELGWKPTVTFQNLVEMMVESDLRRIGQSPD
jgi:GDPmannose 4,6-dehydratase